ncbi:diguanylate cyclase [Salipaludibacillus sp. HK11]|uniref:GGDEF domain-containing protein n=1 Tax=Salipaludibacillus sp. HK11 TaxID=3394320 RepID=UPI0039FC6BF7
MISNIDTSQLFEQAFRFSSIGIALVSIEGKFMLSNPMLSEMLGYSENEFKELSFEDLTHSADVEKSKYKAEKLLDGTIDNYQIEKRYIHKDGKVIWCLLNVSIVKNSKEVPIYFISQFQDITQRKFYEQELTENQDKLMKANNLFKKLSEQDGLTGVANRRYFDEQLEYHWREATKHQQQLSLIMLDLDYFKDFNDYYGHHAGDDCLKLVTATIERKISSSNVFARYGGEEFSIILPNSSEKDAYDLAEELREAVEQLRIPHEKSSVLKSVTISLGVASISPQNSMKSKHLIKQADDALYSAKNNGRNDVENQVVGT